MANNTRGSTKRRNNVSKNKKKNWRKHTDIEDVEEFLEEQRLQIRTGYVDLKWHCKNVITNMNDDDEGQTAEFGSNNKINPFLFIVEILKSHGL